MAVLFAAAAAAQDLKEALARAAQSDTTDYITTRDEIVRKGQSVIPGLVAIMADKTTGWKARLVAGICKERIEKAKDIEEMEKRTWLADQEFKPEWKTNPIKSWSNIQPLIVKRYKEQQLWFHCLEAMWKGPDVCPEAMKVDRNRWERACEIAVEDSPMRDWAITVLEGRIEGDITLRKNRSAEEAFLRLLDLESRRSVPLLLKAWRAHGLVYSTYIEKIMKLAGPEHLDALEELIKDPAVQYDNSEADFKNMVRRLRLEKDGRKTSSDSNQ